MNNEWKSPITQAQRFYDLIWLALMTVFVIYTLQKQIDFNYTQRDEDYYELKSKYLSMEARVDSLEHWRLK